MPGNDDLSLANEFEGIPGALIGMGVVYALGIRGERAAAAQSA